jgi:hypothetical protein
MKKQELIPQMKNVTDGHEFLSLFTSDVVYLFLSVD